MLNASLFHLNYNLNNKNSPSSCLVSHLMRFLKNKIALAQAAASKPSQLIKLNSQSAPAQIISILSQADNLNEGKIPKRRRIPGFSFTSEKAKITKNISLNYGKAIASFALSDIALDYLEELTKNEKIKLCQFIAFLSSTRDKIRGISGFRSLLLITNKDCAEVAACKRVFKALCEIFIKYFSVNWIIHGKMVHKEVYLKYRSKMLRRIQNPEHFTYIKANDK